MATLPEHEKTAFLLATLKSAMDNGGKVIWSEVGAKLNLKADTASKRLSAITKAHQKEKDNGTSGDVASITAASKAPGKNASSRKPSTKKQKLSDGEVKSTGDDDEAGTEEEGKPKAAGRKRGRPAKSAAENGKKAISVAERKAAKAIDTAQAKAKKAIKDAAAPSKADNASGEDATESD